MTANNPIADLLAAPLDPQWTIDRLAEQVLGTIAAQPPGEAQEFFFTADAAMDRQSRRLIRPLLACLATKSAAETGMPVNVFEGQLSFKRADSQRPVWIHGQFVNRPGKICITLHRSTSLPESAPTRNGEPHLDGVAALEPN